MRIIALDPGKATGIAEFVGDPEGEHAMEAHTRTGGEAMVWVHENVRIPGLDLVLCEDIVITPQTAKKGQDVKTSIEQIGITRYLCWLHGVPFVTQTPSDAKGFSTDNKLRRIGWWTKGSDHPRDATRHLMLYLAENFPAFRQTLLQGG